MIRAVAIGEAMIELRPVGGDAYARAIAGDAYNTAVYLARALGSAGRVSFLTAVGDEPLSAAILTDIEAQGLDASLAFVTPGGQPGLYTITLDARGERSFHYWRSTSAARRWSVELIARGGAEVLAGVDLVYWSGISLAILPPEDRTAALDLLRALKPHVGLIAFDPNVRPKLWPDLDVARRTVEAACGLADIVLPSAVDGDLIWGEADPQRQLDRYAALGAVEIALTAGPAGAWLRTAAGTEPVPAPDAHVVDTSGAGDSFNGAYLAARLQGVPPHEAATAGLALAARVVAAPGALIPVDLSHPCGHTP
jgi:2-dehydro-3-deoxygluconokinase